MHKKLFAELVQSMTEMGEIARGQRPPLREFHVDVLGVEKLRVKRGSSHPKIAAGQHVGEKRSGRRGGAR